MGKIECISMALEPFCGLWYSTSGVIERIDILACYMTKFSAAVLELFSIQTFSSHLTPVTKHLLVLKDAILCITSCICLVLWCQSDQSKWGGLPRAIFGNLGIFQRLEQEVRGHFCRIRD